MNRNEKQVEEIKKPKVKKGDEVLVICGKDRGRRGKVNSVDGKKQTCIIEKINEYKKHQKPQKGMNTRAPIGGGKRSAAGPGRTRRSGAWCGDAGWRGGWRAAGP